LIVKWRLQHNHPFENINTMSTQPESRVEQDTIAAIATATGLGGVGIVRISGKNASKIGKKLLKSIPKPRFADYGPFLDANGETIDMGLALYFVEPNSFTGEDVLELQGHGGKVVLDRLLKRTLALGARLANPGEFAERAFLNDKMDLTQAEAIADLIEAGSEQAARSAIQSLQGVFSDKIHSLVDAVIRVRMFVESAIDFPEEEIDFLSDGKILQQIEAILQNFGAIMQEAQQGVLLRDGMRVVLVGQPNTGKSSLLNALAGRDSAIVTEIAGTTRDVLKEEINIDGLPLHIIDTAGLRESADTVEKEGIRRAWLEIEQADRVLVLVDDRDGITEADKTILQKLPSRLPITVIHNKIDLSAQSAEITTKNNQQHIKLSAKTTEGLAILRDHLQQSMGFEKTSESPFLARRRHLDALERARDYVQQSKRQLVEVQAGELVAEDLRQAQQALSEITGEYSSDDLLGEIFSSFCIGK